MSSLGNELWGHGDVSRYHLTPNMKYMKSLKVYPLVGGGGCLCPWNALKTTITYACDPITGNMAFSPCRRDPKGYTRSVVSRFFDPLMCTQSWPQWPAARTAPNTTTGTIKSLSKLSHNVTWTYGNAGLYSLTQVDPQGTQQPVASILSVNNILFTNAPMGASGHSIPFISGVFSLSQRVL